jgi:hypothetical protein
MGDGWIKEGDSVNLWSYTLLFDVSSFGNWIGAHLLPGIAFLCQGVTKTIRMVRKLYSQDSS